MFNALRKGFGLTGKTMVRRPVTTQYPEQKREPRPRFRGRHILNRYEDGLEKCIGCELCAWACPADAIYVQGADNTPEARYSPGERYGIDYQINYLRCIFCGLCIEACPTRALTMSHEYELSGDSREALIFTKERLLAPAATEVVGSSAEFWVFAVTAVVAVWTGICVVVLRNAVHAALALVLNFFAIAVLYAVLEAQFLAVVQIIVYAGAIMVLFLFVLMLLGITSETRFTERVRGQRTASVLLGA